MIIYTTFTLKHEKSMKCSSAVEICKDPGLNSQYPPKATGHKTYILSIVLSKNSYNS